MKNGKLSKIQLRKTVSTVLAVILTVSAFVPFCFTGGSLAASAEGAAAVIEPEYCNINSALSGKAALTLTNASDNDRFNKQTEFKLLDKEYYNSNIKYYYHMLGKGWKANLDFSAVSAEGYFKLWVKSPHSVRFTVQFLDSSYQVRAYYDVKTSSETDWQGIDMSVSELNVKNSFDFSQVLGVRIQTGTSAATFLSENETLCLGAIEVYDTALPSPNDPKATAEPQGSSAPAELDGMASVLLNGVQDNSRFTKQTDFTLLSDEYYNGEVNYYTYISYSEKPSSDFSLAGDKGYYKLWAKSPYSVKFTVEFIGEGGAKAYYDIKTDANTGWQEINIPVNSLNKVGQFNYKSVAEVRIITGASADTFLKSGDTLTLGAIEIFNVPCPDDTYAKSFETQNAQKESSLGNDLMTLKTNDATDNESFLKQLDLTVISGEYYNRSEGTRHFYYMMSPDWNTPVYDFSAVGKEGYFSLWVKSPHAAGFKLIFLGEKYIVKATYNAKTSADTTGWQRINIPFSELNVTDSSFDFSKILSIRILPAASEEGFLKAGESISFGSIEVYSKPMTVISDRKALIELKNSYAADYKGYAEIKKDFTSDAVGFNRQVGLKVNKNDFYEALPDEQRCLYLELCESGTVNTDLEALLPEGHLRLWVKAPHTVYFTVNFLDKDKNVKGSFEGKTASSAGWQQIIIPISEIASSEQTLNFGDVCTLKIGIGNKPYRFASEGETAYFGALEVYDTKYVKTPQKVFLPNTSYLPDAIKETASFTRTDCNDNSAFSTQANIKILSEEFYNKEASARYFYLLLGENWQPNLDMSDVGLDGHFILWVKSPHSTEFTVNFLNGKYETKAYFNAKTTDDTGWQQIVMPATALNVADKDFDFSKLVAVRVIPSASSDKFLSAGETLSLGAVEVYSESVPGYEAPDYVDLGKAEPKKNYTAIFDHTTKNPSTNVDGVDVQIKMANTSLFFTKMSVTLNNSDEYFSRASQNITFYTNNKRDIHLEDAINNGYMELWIKTPHSVTFDIVASCAGWPTGKLRFTTADGTEWQKVTLQMSDFLDMVKGMTYDNLNVLQIAPVTEKSFISEGESFEIGRVIVYCPTDEVGSSGVGKEYPTDISELNRYDGPNFKITESTLDFWSSAYGTTPRMLKNESGAIAKDDVNYNRFKKTMRFWISDIEGYYKKNFSVAGQVYLSKPTNDFGRELNVNLQDYILTGTLRTYLKVDKKISVYIGLSNGVANREQEVYIPVALEPTEEYNGFTEIQIPLKSFYDEAVRNNIPFRFDLVDKVFIKAVDSTPEGFLAEDESITYGTFEFWAKEAPETAAPDNTVIYTSSNLNGIEVVDINEILPGTTVVNAFRNTVENSEMRRLLKEFSAKAEFKDSLCIYTISDNSTDARLTTPYDKVKIKIPLKYLYSGGGITAENASQIKTAVYYNKAYKNLKTEIDGEYMYVETQIMGDFLFFTGEAGKDTVILDEDDRTDADNIPENMSNNSDDTSGKTTIKRVTQKKVRRIRKDQEGFKIIWLAVCIAAALVLLAGGYFGYRKFISKTLCILLVMLIGVFGFTDMFAGAASPSGKTIDLKLVQDHPGVPGYDAEYKVIVDYGDETDKTRLTPDEYTLSAELKEIRINGDSFTVPASFKDNTEIDGFKIKVSLKSNAKITSYYPMMIKNWSKTLEDDFDGDALDPNIWSQWDQSVTQTPQDGGKYGQTTYVSQDCVSVENGNLVLRILKGENGTAYSGGNAVEADYLQPRVMSSKKFNQKYGCFTADMKFPYQTQAGSNTAFWLLPQSGSWGKAFLFDQTQGKLSGNSCGEIDIIEYSPAWKNGEFQSAFHHWNSSTLVKTSGSEMRSKYNKMTSGEYVNMACVWNNNSVCIYYDGILQRKVKNIVAHDDAAYILFTIQTGGYGNTTHWVGNFTDSDVEKMVCYIDCVKVYE